MNALTTKREIECGAFKAQIIGPAHSCQLWISGRLYSKGINTLREARRQFMSYATRHNATKDSK